MAGLLLHLLFNADTLVAGSWGSGDGKGTGISCKVRDAWVGPTVGRSSLRVVVSVIVYMVDLDASLTNVPSTKAPPMLEMRSE